MKPETRDVLDLARVDLEDARKIRGLPLPKVAARCAYYAMFHAAEALIFEETGRVAKTHSGVRSEFSRLMIDRTSHDPPLATLLRRAYSYKEICDYRTGPTAVVSIDQADALIAEATILVNAVAILRGT